MGKQLEQIEVGLTFERDYDGQILALPRGRCKLKGVTRDAIDVSPSSVPLLRSHEPNFCWRAFMKNAIITCAGPAAEMKHRTLEHLPRGHIIDSDAMPVEWHQRFVWTTAGRDGIAFQRLAWQSACKLMDHPLIWKAVQAVEAALFSGLLALEPMDPRPGDSVKFVMPGERAEELMVRAGIVLPNIIATHECDAQCIKPSRRTSRRWQEYLDAWAKEEPRDAAA